MAGFGALCILTFDRHLTFLNSLDSPNGSSAEAIAKRWGKNVASVRYAYALYSLLNSRGKVIQRFREDIAVTS
jgi:hypothetical protein